MPDDLKIQSNPRSLFPRRAALLLAAMVLLSPAAEWSAAGDSSRTFDPAEFGAKPDGVTMDTVAIQAAINAASKAGGGIVRLLPGTYLSGSLRLKSHVELRVEAGATLLGSTSRPDYQKAHWYALLLAEKQKDIRLSGAGTIDGQGLALGQDVAQRVASGEIGKQSRNDRPDEPERPQLIEFVDCRDVRVSGVTLKNSSCWTQDYIRCEDLTIEGIKVDSTVYYNNDGLDITDCRRVHISKCDINSDDDGICLKSGYSAEPAHEGKVVTSSGECYDVNIADCRIRSSASALKFGTASAGGFRKIRVANLYVRDTLRTAIALECVDGGVLDDVVVEDVTAKNTGGAIFLRLGQRRTNAPPGSLQNITIRNVKVEVPAGKPDAGYQRSGPTPKFPHNIFPSVIAGLKGAPVRNVHLENIEITCPGGGDASVASVGLDQLESIPEKAALYPEVSMFGELPAWGFYVRHVEGLDLKNVRLVRRSPDYRPAIVLDDVQQLKAGELSLEPNADVLDLALQYVRHATFAKTGFWTLGPKKFRIAEDCAAIEGLRSPDAPAKKEEASEENPTKRQ